MVVRGPSAGGVVVPAAALRHVDRSTGPGVAVRAGIAGRDKRREETTAAAVALHEIVFLTPCRRCIPPYTPPPPRRRRLSPAAPSPVRRGRVLSCRPNESAAASEPLQLFHHLRSTTRIHYSVTNEISTAVPLPSETLSDGKTRTRRRSLFTVEHRPMSKDY